MKRWAAEHRSLISKTIGQELMIQAKDRLFVALDVDSAGEALKLVSTLGVCTRRFKIGSRLFTAAGPDIVRRIVATGAEVFLDLKFHDIPNTVGAAAGSNPPGRLHV